MGYSVASVGFYQVDRMIPSKEAQMDLDSLKNYVNWIGKSPEEIRKGVINVGGWKVVFPGRLPLWAHRIRNYFNVEPEHLTRLDPASARYQMQKISHDLDLMQAYKKVKLLKNHPVWGLMPEVKMFPDPPAGTPSYGPNMKDNIFDEIGENKALSGDVYKGNADMIWYQMSPGGAIYHFKKPTTPALEAPLQSLVTQVFTPVFKLVSPDRTGGSCETIIENRFDQVIPVMNRTYVAGRFAMGLVNQKKGVKGLINKDEEYQGSYNYSETVITGMAAHKERDVEPHERDHSFGIYINPPDRHAPLTERRFPTHDRPGGIFLAAQISPA